MKITSRLLAVLLVLSVVACTMMTGCAGKNGSSAGLNGDNAQSAELNEIKKRGEIVVVTHPGKTTYFKLHGRDWGYHYLLAEAMADSLGVKVKWVFAETDDEMLKELLDGNADLIAANMVADKDLEDRVSYCGEQQLSHFIDSITLCSPTDSAYTTKSWAVRKGSPKLAQYVNKWLESHASEFWEISKPRLCEYVPEELDSATGIPIYMQIDPILNEEAGIISPYDSLFRRYAPACSWDWRLLAAQAFQESRFDPQAISRMSAMGLVQLLPSTAMMRKVSIADILDPEYNVIAAVQTIKALDKHYSSVWNSSERLNFVLAAYNGGMGHVDDCRRLAAKYKKNPNIWTKNVDSAALWLMEDSMFNDPVVKHGYLRGTETYNYVRLIRNRWNLYKQKIKDPSQEKAKQTVKPAATKQKAKPEAAKQKAETSSTKQKAKPAEAKQKAKPAEVKQKTKLAEVKQETKAKTTKHKSKHKKTKHKK